AACDRYRRPRWLHVETARAWGPMRDAALRDDVVLEAISGYRSHDYQLGIFERKRVRGDSIEQILRVNAAPGYSEHHSGRALDVGTPGEPPAEESFERTAAFAWLRDHAGGYGGGRAPRRVEGSVCGSLLRTFGRRLRRTHRIGDPPQVQAGVGPVGTPALAALQQLLRPRHRLGLVDHLRALAHPQVVHRQHVRAGEAGHQHPLPRPTANAAHRTPVGG